jgi:hypothetical protein
MEEESNEAELSFLSFSSIFSLFLLSITESIIANSSRLF